MKIILDKFSIRFLLNLLPKNFPKEIARKLLETIPQIEPKTKDILYEGYWKPRPKEARNVLSPSSPITILIAMIKM